MNGGMAQIKANTSETCISIEVRNCSNDETAVARLVCELFHTDEHPMRLLIAPLAAFANNFGSYIMNRIVALASVATLSLGVAFAGDAAAQSVPNTESGIKPLNLAPGAAEPTRGVVFFTAAINSDGTIASCFECVPANTKRLGVGEYQIDFGENIQAINAGVGGFRRTL
jgi:hypothetical protein